MPTPGEWVRVCRRTLEAAADARGVGGRLVLHRRIAKMVEDGVITAEFREAMDYARLMRNVGAHAGQDVSRESAHGAMRFTQQALRLLFEVQGELRELRGPEATELAGD